MKKQPLTLKLHLGTLARTDGLARLLHAEQGGVCPKLLSAFAFKNDERPFARKVLRRHPRLWLYRVNQRAFGGDFVAVDMSTRFTERRRAWCVDLKRGAQIKLGGGGAGVAFVRLGAAVDEIAARGVLVRDHGVVRATGDGCALIARLWDQQPQASSTRTVTRSHRRRPSAQRAVSSRSPSWRSEISQI